LGSAEPAAGQPGQPYALHKTAVTLPQKKEKKQGEGEHGKERKKA